ncbi:hypothetical protein [Romboutsia ilealis]|uniref:hypothetical protein n=1 Tax=Romboutsia ilealis TaxID=1115758 RepID=UPI00272B5872|nr:hypothetical protein [Romboutsia ilealis]
MEFKNRNYACDSAVKLTTKTPPPKSAIQPGFEINNKNLQVFHTFEIDELNEFLKTIPLSKIVNRQYIPVTANARIHYIIEYII